MSSFKFPVHARLVTALVGLISLSNLHAYAKTPEPPGLFSEQSTTEKLVLPRQTIAGKSRGVKLNHEKLHRGRFFVNLPGGVSYEAVRELQKDHGNGRSSWTGHAADDPEATIVLGVSGDAVAGTFNYQGKLFKLEPRADGSHVLSEVQATDPAPELDPIPVADSTSIISSLTTSADGSVSTDTNGSVIDVLVAYTPAIKALYGTQGSEALIIQAVAEANQAYANSGMKTRLNLVRSALTSYVESGDMNTDLSRLRTPGDGYMDELHTLRDTYGADLVNLIENAPQYCGLSYRMATLSASFASSAFSVVHHSCATGYYSFAHELGHNQGAHHDAANASGAIFPYAYGYQEPYRAFRTIMAYDCPGGCPRIAHFSNAEILYNGIPTGYTGSAENADAIDTTAATVASFRQSAVLAPPPAAPSGLSGTGINPSQIDLNWTDRSVNESGFILERSMDGSSFAQIASVVANTTSYHDENLAAGTSYYYRARAWNSSGNSGYSNVATTATVAIPKSVEQLVAAESSAAGKLTGSFLDTRSLDGTRETITEIRSAGSKKLRYSYLEHYWAIQVKPGKTITLYADASTTSLVESFTFAYSTSFARLTENPTGWIDMFTVSGSNPGVRQFTLPAASPTGWFFISARDKKRVAGTNGREALQIDYLAIRTE